MYKEVSRKIHRFTPYIKKVNAKARQVEKYDISMTFGRVEISTSKLLWSFNNKVNRCRFGINRHTYTYTNKFLR